MAKYKSKPVVIEATRWFRNGDHPNDDTHMLGGGDKPAFMSEGKIVRYFRRPDVPGNLRCQHCQEAMHVHGFIDTVQGGHSVCPGDWIITEPDGKGYYPCKNSVFDMKYEPESAPER